MRFDDGQKSNSVKQKARTTRTDDPRPVTLFDPLPN